MGQNTPQLCKPTDSEIIRFLGRQTLQTQRISQHHFTEITGFEQQRTMEEDPRDSQQGERRRRTRTETQTSTQTQDSTETTQQKRKNRRFNRPKTNIINLSKYTLKPGELSLLNKGLNFIPTPRKDHPAKLLQDYLLFERKMRLKHHFHGKEEETDTFSSTSINLLHPSKGWTPPSGADIYLDSYRSQTMQTLLDKMTTQQQRRNNLKKNEKEAIETLMKNKDIIIKPADKGGCIVIQNREDYIKEGYRQMDNRVHYRPLLTDPTERYNNELNQILTDALKNNQIDEKTKETLSIKHPRTANFYTLPKIHKKDNPGRPVVNSIGSVTEKISAYVDETLKPLARLVPSYIKDTTHFINTLEDIDITDNDILVTIDVSALYTNIPHTEGIEAIREWMTVNNKPRENIDLICTLTEFVLTKNYFEFNKSLYLQVHGTAMGTRMSPNYAIIFMHQLESRLQAGYHLQPKIWRRFIDDIFMIWQHGREELIEYMEYLNNQHPTIKFTYEQDQEQIAFLDTIAYKDNGHLSTKIYHKPTDNKQYLHYNSAHPKKQKDSVPYGLFIRCKRISSKEEDFETESQSIITKLKRRNYPTALLEEALQKVRNTNREDLLIDKQKTDKQCIRYITNYNPCNPNIKEILSTHEAVLNNMRNKAFTGKDLQVVYARSDNLRDILIQGSLHTQKITRGCHPCNKPCMTCNRINTEQSITTNQNITYPIRGEFDCQSHDTIYAMTCNICNMRYVGETTTTVNTRFRSHETAIRQDRGNPVSIHYNLPQHSYTDYNVTLLDKEPLRNRRLRLEEAWMILLNTLQPNGLNGRL